MNPVNLTACQVRSPRRGQIVIIGALLLGVANLVSQNAAAQASTPPASTPAADVPATPAATAATAVPEVPAAAAATSEAPVKPTVLAPRIVDARTPDELGARYPSGMIQSMETANQALGEVARLRDRIDQDYEAQKYACYSKFLATDCLDTAKENHRQGVKKIRRVEVEANSYIRSARVVERDKRLAEKRANDAANPPKPITESPARPAPPPPTGGGEDRLAKHDAKLRQEQLDAAADAQKRADNVAAYEKKVKDAEARQRDIAAKKAEKEKQAAAKAASAAKSSATTSAATPAATTQPTPAASKP